jgi:hypothetical protein
VKRNDRDEISKEAYREMYHRVKEENARLRTADTSQRHDAEEVWEDLEHTLGTAVGYFRAGRSGNGHYWVRWKWTAGPHAGRYSIGGHTTLRNAALVCLADVSAVESGKKVAPLDVGYKSR